MRGGTNWRSIIAAPEGHWAFSFLEVTDYDGTWVNLGNLAIGARNVDFKNSYDLEDDIDRNTLTFSASLRGSVGVYSLMPFRTDSPLNVDAGSAYQPLLDLHRQWRLWVCFTPRGTFPEGPEDYRERARGIVDRIDLSFARDEIRVQGRGPEADFIDDLVVCDETTPKVYAAGPVADVLQAMLDDRYGVATYTLVVDASAPSEFIDEITYTEPFSFWKVFSDVAAVGTGIVRFMYDDSDSLDIHLFTPNREADTGDEDWSVGPEEYGDIDNGLDLSTVANYIVARFVNASGAIQTVTSPTVDPAITPTASTARYGIKPAVITLAPNKGLSDATRVQAMIDAIRADRELPILGQVIKGSGLWFGELWDYVGTPANPVLYNEDQAGGVVGYHESGRNSVIDHTFTIAGKPKGRYATWLDLGSGGTAALPVAPAMVSLSATYKETVFTPVAYVDFVGVVNETTQSVLIEYDLDPDFPAPFDSIAYDVVSGQVAGLNGPLATADRNQIYYVRATPYSGPVVALANTGTAGQYMIAHTIVEPKFIDSATATINRSTTGALSVDVVTTGGSGVAPDTADYLVKTANAGLSAERVVTDTTTIAADWATAGQAKFNVVNGSLGVAKLSATGAPSSTTYLRGDNTWATSSGGLSLPTPVTAGDIYYAATTGASALTRLPIGTAGQVLFVSAGLPTWGDLSGGVVVDTPIGSGATDDPFDGSGALTSPWESFNSPTSALKNGSGSLAITTSSNGIGADPRGVRQVLPGSGDWARETSVSMPLQSNGEGIGIYIVESSTGKWLTCGVGMEGTTTCIRVNSAAAARVREQRLDMVMSTYSGRFRVQRIGNIVSFYYSFDSGATWTLFYDALVTAHFTTEPDKVGLFVANPVAAVTATGTFAYYREVTPIPAVSIGSHTYWGVQGSVAAGGQSLWSVAEVEMRATVGGSDQCSGGTASATNNFDAGTVPANAFDNNTATIFASASLPSRLVYQFASPVSLAELAMTTRNDGAWSQIATSFLVQYSDDGSSWTTAKTCSLVPWTGSTQTKTFLVP